MANSNILFEFVLVSYSLIGSLAVRIYQRSLLDLLVVCAFQYSIGILDAVLLASELVCLVNRFSIKFH